MNKSKFLKKSLATILSVLLVVAMIPLSAAAEGLVPKIYVNNDGPATLSGSTFSVTTGNVSTARLSWEAPDTGTNGNTLEVTFKDKYGEKINWDTSINANNVTKTKQIDLDQWAFVNPDKTQYTLSIHTVETVAGTNDTKIENDYTLVITKDESAAKENADVDYVHSSVGAVSGVVGQDVITLTMPFGGKLPGELIPDTGAGYSTLPYEGGVDADTNGSKLSKLKHWFQPVKPDDIATMTWDVSTDSRYNYTLKLQTKGADSNKVVTKTYNVLVQYEKGFTAFTVPNQVGDTRFTQNGTVIDIDVPANYLQKDATASQTNWSKLIVPSFTLDPKWSKVETATQMNQSALGTSVNPGTGLSFTYKSESAAATYAITGTYTGITSSISLATDVGIIELRLVSATDSNKKVPVLIRLHEQKNAQNELKTVLYYESASDLDSASVKSVETEVAESGTTIVKVPNSYTIPDSQNENYKLEVVASEKAVVSVDGQQEVAVQDTGDTPTTGLYADDAKYHVFVISNIQPNLTLNVRVSPEDGSTPKVYAVKIQKDIAEAQIASFILKHPTTGEILKGVPNRDKKEVRIPVPYKYADDTTLASWVIFMTPTAGTTTSPAVINGTTTYNTVFSGVNIGDEKAITLTYGSNPAVTWNVVLDAASPNQSHQLFTTGQEIVGTDNFGEITSGKTYTDIKVGTGVDTSGNKINTVEVSVPWSFSASNLSFTKLAKSTNSTVWLDTGTAWGAQVTEMPTNSYADHAGTISVTASTITNALKTDGSVVTANAIKLYVLNEAATGNAASPIVTPGLAWADRDTDSRVTLYYLYCVKQAPKTGHDLISIESTTDKNVTARLNPVTKHVEINVPASYNASVSASNQGSQIEKTFTLNFNLSDQATMKGVKADASGPMDFEINSDKGSTATSNRTKFFVSQGYLYVGDNTGSFGPDFNRLTGGEPAVATQVGGTAVTGTLRVIAENDTATTPNYEDYIVDFKIDPWQTEAKLNSLSVNGTKAAIGELNADSKAEVKLTLPVGTQLSSQTIDLTVSKTATVTVNGFNWSADRKFDLSKDVTIKVVSEDKSKENTYTLKTELSQGFNDVHTSDWFYNDVMTAVNNGWVQGTGNGNFTPYGTMTRAQFALIIARMDKSFNEEAAITDCPFPDVNGTAYQAAAKYVYDKKYMQGDNLGNFNPNKPITRQEAAIVLCNFKGIAPEEGATTYADNSGIASWALGYVKAATTAGIFQGDNTNRFNATKQLKRCEGAAILVRSAK